jgi:hypothetical protein
VVNEKAVCKVLILKGVRGHEDFRLSFGFCEFTLPCDGEECASY